MLYGFRDRCRSTRGRRVGYHNGVDVPPNSTTKWLAARYFIGGYFSAHWWRSRPRLEGSLLRCRRCRRCRPLRGWRAGVLVSLALALVGVVKPVAVVAVDEEARCREEDAKAGWPNTFIDFSTSCNAY